MKKVLPGTAKKLWISYKEEKMKQAYGERLFLWKYDWIMRWLEMYRDLSPKKGSEIFNDLRVSAGSFGKNLGIIE